jgi:thiamine biosynthesis lipoprotein
MLNNKANFATMSVVKEMFSRKRILPLLLMVVIIIFWYANRPAPLVQVSGTTFGTIAYHVKYKDKQQRDFTNEIDSLLTVFNNALSHYVPSSEVSEFNRSAGEAQGYRSPFFYPVLQESRRIYDLSQGAYNPAIMPLVNAWGFGPKEGAIPDSLTIDSLRAFTSFDLVKFDQQKVLKEDPRVQLDFSASAKGYGVDVVGHFLESRAVTDYFVEIGGEVYCHGTNKQGKPWVIGILSPESELLNQYFYATAGVTDQAVATSANNFNYRVVDGVRYTHTIDPATGYPAQRAILSATIFAPECITADALATACMVLGKEKAVELIESMEAVEAMFIYSKDDGTITEYITAGAKPLITIKEVEGNAVQ